MHDGCANQKAEPGSPETRDELEALADGIRDTYGASSNCPLPVDEIAVGAWQK